jgi:hypothetical protein
MDDMSHNNGPTILLSSGVYFNYDRPDQSNFSIGDIAKGLSNTCRFGGQCQRFYSVAEHCVLMSDCMPADLAFQALMHDAAEAFICDMPKPLKMMLPDYMAVEDRVEAAIADRFGLPAKMSPAVKEMDIRMLAAEQQQVMGNNHKWRYTYELEAAPVKVKFWSPEMAEMRFLARFKDLAP